MMTLLDALVYYQTRSNNRRILLGSFVFLCLVVAMAAFLAWNLPAEHRVDEFFAAVEGRDFPKAFGVWNNDPNWQEHPQRYANAGYAYGRFVNDWGRSSDYGVITSHKILYSTSRYGNSTLFAVEINGRKAAPLTLSVEKITRSMTFPPFALSPIENGFGWTVWQINYSSR
jgi:hypothetical protein